jgi:hypothetical protein
MKKSSFGISLNRLLDMRLAARIKDEYLALDHPLSQSAALFASVLQEHLSETNEVLTRDSALREMIADAQTRMLRSGKYQMSPTVRKVCRKLKIKFSRKCLIEYLSQEVEKLND